MTSEEFHSFYQEHQPYLRALLFRFVGPSDLDDVVQESFIKIYNNLNNFENRSSIKTWCTRIAINTAKDFLRKKQRGTWLEIKDPQDLSHSSELTSSWEEQVAKESLANILKKLSPKLKEVLILYSMKDLEIKEIAEILKIPEGTVKSRLNEARNKFKEQL